MKKLIPILCLLSFITFFAASAEQFPAPVFKIEPVFHGTWGNASDQIGVSWIASGVFREGIKTGPSAFHVDDENRVWISDSMNKRMVCFAPGGKTSLFKLSEGIPSDFSVSSGSIFICMAESPAIIKYNLQTGEVQSSIQVPWKSPNRMLFISEDLIAIENQSSELWIYRKGKWFLYPSDAMEPAGTKENIFGIAYYGIENQRKILVAPWFYEQGEPETYSEVELPGDKIVFSKILGVDSHGIPVFAAVSRNHENILRMFSFDKDGNAFEICALPVLQGPHLVSQWIFEKNDRIFGFSGDEKGFTIYEANLKEKISH
ncbi:MAG: hypothetical protein HQM10_24445 [Candidatus Riflebacteria bacterium]|nr:hypothetical protein [Candidatus Riflebacteria bacterium]